MVARLKLESSYIVVLPFAYALSGTFIQRFLLCLYKNSAGIVSQLEATERKSQVVSIIVRVAIFIVGNLH